MTIVLPLGLIGVILSFVLSVMGLFPGLDSASGESTTTLDPDATYEEGAVHQAGSLFFSMYTSIIDDMMYYQENPDALTAGGSQAEMATYAETIVPMFQELSDYSEAQMDILEAEAAALEEETATQ
jgi:hypothetical protein